jgi:uncharacterized protein
MTQSAKAQEPSMEEILASIRRIIADDDASKTAKPPEAPPAKPAPPPAAVVPVRPVAPPQPAPPRPAAPPPAANNQSEIDAMLADLEAPAKPAAPPPAPKPAAPSADVLDLTEAMAAPPPPPPTPSPGPAPTFRTIDGAADVIFTDRPPDPEPPAVRALEETRRTFAQPTAAERSLLSSTASAAVDSAFSTLAQTMLVNNARTIEDLVKDMLRPMLKAWLDDNLPGLVERIVRTEIERVSRGRP